MYRQANPMDQIIPGLWVGDADAACDSETLRANGIKYILSAVRLWIREKDFVSGYVSFA